MKVYGFGGPHWSTDPSTFLSPPTYEAEIVNVMKLKDVSGVKFHCQDVPSVLRVLTKEIEERKEDLKAQSMGNNHLWSRIDGELQALLKLYEEISGVEYRN